MVFANSFFVAPNSIDFSSVFLKFSPLSQAAVLGALSGIFLIYFIVIIFLIRLDRRDTLKVSQALKLLPHIWWFEYILK